MAPVASLFENFKYMKILVTGGCGFIGSHIVEHYQFKAEVIVLDDLRTGSRSNLDGLKCEIVEGSILDKILLSKVMKGVDYVFHLAALVSVPESMSLPIEAVNINVIGLLNVLETASLHGAKKVCFASSAAVYGENAIQPKVESMAPDPRSPYAVTKLDGEYYCALYAREKRLSTVSLRFFNVFGPRQDPKSAYAAAVPIFFRQAQMNETITVHGDGGQTRDFVYVKDIVSALAFTAEASELEGTFNVGYGSSISISEIVKEIIQITDSRSEIRYEPTRVGDIRHSTSDSTKLVEAGWSPSYGVSTGLRELVKESF